jgi:hypothetical protein
MCKELHILVSPRSAPRFGRFITPGDSSIGSRREAFSSDRMLKFAKENLQSSGSGPQGETQIIR